MSINNIPLLARRLVVKTILAICLITPCTTTAYSEEFVVIINSRNPIANWSVAKIKNFYLKKRTSWPGGSKVRPVDRIGSPPAKEAFLRQVLKLSTDELKQYWLKERYVRGVSTPPSLNSDSQVLEYVLAFDGAIGYVKSDSIPSQIKNELQIVHRYSIP